MQKMCERERGVGTGTGGTHGVVVGGGGVEEGEDVVEGEEEACGRVEGVVVLLGLEGGPAEVGGDDVEVEVPAGWGAGTGTGARSCIMPMSSL